MALASPAAMSSQRATDMTNDRTDFPCEICGSNDAAEIEVARNYTDGHPLHVCKDCGFVFVRERRSAAAIADDWSNRLYGGQYTARIPAVRARQTFVAEFIDTTIGLDGKTVCDIGAGEGLFLKMIEDPPFNAKTIGVEPSAQNCSLMDSLGIENFVGTIEDYIDSDAARPGQFDVVTIVWTLENCQSCHGMLDAANKLLKPGGHIVVGTGSRILVPFKKPLDYYLGPGPQDTHAFRFTANSLRSAFANSGFTETAVNRYIDNDILCMIGEKTDAAPVQDLPRDDWRAVIDFFDRWNKESLAHYPPNPNV